MQKKRDSLKNRILLASLLILLPITLTFVVFNGRAITQINKQMGSANKSTLDVFCASIESEMVQAEMFLHTSLSDDEAFLVFGSASTNQGAIDAGTLMERDFEEILNANDNLSCMALYQPGLDVYMAEYSKRAGYDSDDMAQIKGAVCQLFPEGAEPNLGWFIYPVGDNWFWVRAVRQGEGYCICLIDLEQLSKSAQRQYNLSTAVVFVQNNKLLTTTVWMRDSSTLPGFQGKDYIVTGEKNQYIIVRRAMVGLTALYAVPYKASMGSLEWLRTGPLLFFGVMILAFAAAWVYMKRRFFRPLHDLVLTMQRIQSGDLAARPGNFSSREFSQVNETFNAMIGEITSLRIDTYENQLSMQQAQMDALRMQIRPHFFLNSLKNIYGLAQVDKTEEIQNVILLLSAHLRYVFDLSTEVVTLEKELQMCQNYIDLQAISHSQKVIFTLSVDPDLMGVHIPPISLLTLLENSIKYGGVHDTVLEVGIEAKRLSADASKLHILLRDNGPGFSPQMLIALNGDAERAGLKSHIGLINVIRRFRLLYGSLFSITFANHDGAQIELVIPFTQREAL